MQQAFIKMRLTIPVLGYPDLNKPYILDTNVSDVGVGAILSQVQGVEERIIAYYTQTLTLPP